MDEPKTKQKSGMAGRRCLSVILCVALACASAMARDLLVKGRVMSGDEPLAGATVQQKDILDIVFTSDIQPSSLEKLL